MFELDRNALIEKLYEQYFDKLVLYCMTMTGYRSELRNMTEECVQEVFYFALERYRKLQNHPDVEGWLFRCCDNRMRNMLFKYHKRSQKHAYSSDMETSPELIDPHDSFLYFEEEKTFYGCIDRMYELLLDSEKQIFDTYFLQGYGINEVAELTGKSIGSVKSVIYRIRKRLKNTFFTFFPFYLMITRLFRF